MPGNEFHLRDIGLVERRIIANEDPFRAINKRGDLVSDGGGVGFEMMQQPSEGIVGGGGLDATDGAGCGDEEVNVIGGGTA